MDFRIETGFAPVDGQHRHRPLFDKQPERVVDRRLGEGREPLDQRAVYGIGAGVRQVVHQIFHNRDALCGQFDVVTG